MHVVANPWYDLRNQGSQRTLSYAGKRLLSHRGVEVYKNPAGSWDYTLNGMAITQRAGFNQERAKALIDSMLSGEDLMMNDRVRSHITLTKENAQ